MATFASQSSNLSALGSALTSFATLLDVSDDAIAKLTQVEHQEQAEQFLQNQKRRVRSIDESLLKATEHILPPSPESKTVTELAELCKLVQEATRQKMGLLRTRLELLGVRTSWQDSVTSPQILSRDRTNTQIHWSVGGPLDCVIEADVETDGATTPGSLMQPSPFASTTKRKESLTPTTPTLNTFAFSSSTASILEKMNLPSNPQSNPKTPGRGLKTSPTPTADNRRSDRQLNFDGFHDEDDMISIYTAEQHSKAALKVHGSPRSLPTPKEERAQFLARMESMLQRVEEELLHESRPSDETNGISRKGSVGRSMERPSNSKFLEELVIHEESGDDDSTNVIATLVAEKPQPSGTNIMRPVPVFHRPTHIVVDTAAVPSPSHTNITMDGTMMNDTMISTTILHDDDNDSTVTPVLDRYRLDPDDNSIGIKVVPNRRGKHVPRGIQTSDPTTDAMTTEFYTDSEGFLSPKGLPGSVSARKTKQYRKTPFPKKEHQETFDDENHPNTRSLTFSTPPSTTSSFDAANPESSFSVPPLRPRSLGPTRTISRNATTPRTQSLSAKDAFVPTTPRQQVIGKDKADESFARWMEKITMAEYKIAPRVVQMQVTRDEVNRSIDTLDNLLTSKYQASQILEFSAHEAYDALSNVLDSVQKSKSVLLSLCHWRRLLMYHDPGNDLMFAVNNFE